MQSYYENKSPTLYVTAKDGVDISRPTKVFIYGGALTTSTSVEVRFDLRRILTIRYTFFDIYKTRTAVAALSGSNGCSCLFAESLPACRDPPVI